MFAIQLTKLNSHDLIAPNMIHVYEQRFLALGSSKQVAHSAKRYRLAIAVSLQVGRREGEIESAENSFSRLNVHVQSLSEFV